MKEFIEKFEKIIQVQGGSVSPVEEWGLRDLAYRIQKQAKGYYTLLRYQSSGRAVEELERNLKLTDGIIRYLTVRVEEESQSNNPPASKTHSEEPVEPTTERSAKSESQV